MNPLLKTIFLAALLSVGRSISPGERTPIASIRKQASLEISLAPLEDKENRPSRQQQPARPHNKPLLPEKPPAHKLARIRQRAAQEQENREETLRELAVLLAALNPALAAETCLNLGLNSI